VDLAELVQVRLVVSAVNNTPIDTITQGESFIVNVIVQDLRPDAEGVFASYLDLIYDSSNVSVNGPLNYSDVFAGDPTGDTSTPGIVDEAGAFSMTTIDVGGSELLLLTVPFVADTEGVVTFDADPADLSPMSDTLLRGINNAISVNQIRFVDDTLTILPAANGEGEGGSDFASTVDEVFAAEEEW
jgi:hypothetical protein